MSENELISILCIVTFMILLALIRERKQRSARNPFHSFPIYIVTFDLNEITFRDEGSYARDLPSSPSRDDIPRKVLPDRKELATRYVSQVAPRSFIIPARRAQHFSTPPADHRLVGFSRSSSMMRLLTLFRILTGALWIRPDIRDVGIR